MPETTLHSDVVDIISRFDTRDLPQKTVTQQISVSPKRFYLTTLLVMVWGLVALTLAPMVTARLIDPIAQLNHQEAWITYAFQVPVVVLVAGFLGRRYGTLTLALYLIAGLAGLPVFAGGGGWTYIEQPCFGYLLGFTLVPWAMGNLMTKAYSGTEWFRGRSIWLILSVVLGVGVIHVLGAMGLMVNVVLGHLSWPEALQWGHQLTALPIAYDMVFGLVAVCLVRLFRLLFWFCLY